MPTILPPPPSLQSLPTATPAAMAVATSNPPPAVAQLLAGTMVRADIVQVLARGLVEAQTEFGTLQLRANLALAEGIKLELQLLRTTPRIQFAIRSVDDRPVPASSPRSAAPTASGSASGAPGPFGAQDAPWPAAAPSAVVATGRPAVSLSVGTVVPATLVVPAPAGTPHGASSRAPGTVAPTAPPAGGPGSPVPPSSAGGTQQSVLGVSPGTRLDVRIVGVARSGQFHAAPGAGTVPPGTLIGTVAALGTNGRPIVQTPLGVITLDVAAPDTRIGTHLQLAVVTQTTRSAAPVRTPSLPETFEQTRAWPALDEAISHLAQRAPLGTQLAALPRANTLLGSSLMFFLTALRGGDVRGWLGDAAAVLGVDRPDLARRVNDEFTQHARAFNEAPADDWRTAAVPFLNGGQLEPVQMHIRGGKSQKGDAQKDDGARFIIDVELSKLGRIQLDGFIKKRTAEKNTLDLIVRSDQPLPQRMRHDINRIFSGFGEAAGLTGVITFQARAQFVEVPLPRLAPRAEDGLVV